VTRLVDQQAANLHCLNRDLLAFGQLLAGDDVLPYLAQLLDNQRFFYGSFDSGTQWDPFRPQAVWARVNILFVEQSGGAGQGPAHAHAADAAGRPLRLALRPGRGRGAPGRPGPDAARPDLAGHRVRAEAAGRGRPRRPQRHRGGPRRAPAVTPVRA
jgi:hypothetical protein